MNEKRWFVILNRNLFRIHISDICLLSKKIVRIFSRPVTAFYLYCIYPSEWKSVAVHIIVYIAFGVGEVSNKQNLLVNNFALQSFEMNEPFE